jgi:glycosyltransferase involved in cell wall biosynthesis
MSLRIAVSAGNLVPQTGGAWTFTTQIREALRACSTEHQFTVLDETALQPVGTVQIAVKRFVDSGRKFASPRLRRSISSLLPRSRFLSPLQGAVDAIRPDIVWYLHPNAVPLDIPYIVTVWDLEHRKQPCFPEVGLSRNWWPREESYSASLPRASYVITGTEVGKQEIVHFYSVDQRNVRVVPYPVPAPEVRATPNAVRDPAALSKFGICGDFIFYPAQFWPHKNHFNLIKALGILRDESNTQINLILTGKDMGNLRYIQETVIKLGLSDQVYHVGFVSRQEIELLYQNALALVYLSLAGPDNLPPLEAFSWGCPVIAADIPGATEQLGSSALLCDPTNPADIAAKLRMLLQSETCRRDLIKAGASIAAARTPAAYVSKMLEIFDEFEVVRRCWGQSYPQF